MRSLPEIRATLDAGGALDGLPFMPEMEPYAGRRFRVFRRADRVCVEGQPQLRRVRDAVFLEDLRCDGAAHGACSRGCLFFWKEAWLMPEERRTAQSFAAPAAAADTFVAGAGPEAQVFACQSTALAGASTPLPWWDPRPYARDVATGNVPLPELLRAFRATIGVKLGAIRRRVAARLLAGRPVRPCLPGLVLDLRAGDWVRVRSLHEIKRTLDAQQRHRGLEFAPGMELHCGHTYRVLRRLDRIILETSGRMRTLSDTVVLEGVECDGRCSRGCPRRNRLFWREAWLERTSPPQAARPRGE